MLDPLPWMLENFLTKITPSHGCGTPLLLDVRLPPLDVENCMMKMTTHPWILATPHPLEVVHFLKDCKINSKMTITSKHYKTLTHTLDVRTTLPHPPPLDVRPLPLGVFEKFLTKMTPHARLPTLWMLDTPFLDVGKFLMKMTTFHGMLDHTPGC